MAAIIERNRRFIAPNIMGFIFGRIGFIAVMVKLLLVSVTGGRGVYSAATI
jgi:hypothetical protein